ncbi:MAG: NAD(P)-dependent oxidoreductase [Nitratireductor sp.]
MISSSNCAAPVRRALVIGGRGFVGSHLVRHFLQRGTEVHVFGPEMKDDLLSDIAGRFSETIGSVEDAQSVTRTVNATRPDVIISTAAYGEGTGLMSGGEANAERAIAVNVEGWRKVLEAAEAAGIKRVLTTGSSVVFGPPSSYSEERLDEGARRAPRTVYGLTKVLSEDIGQYYRDRYGLEVCSIRLPIVLGPGLWYRGAASAISELFESARPGASHSVRFHDDVIDVMHVSDVARAIAAIATDGGALDAVYHINGFSASMSQIIAALRAQVSAYEVNHEYVEPANSFPLMDDSRFRKRYGFVPRYDLDALVRTQITRKAS